MTPAERQRRRRKRLRREAKAAEREAKQDENARKARQSVAYKPAEWSMPASQLPLADPVDELVDQLLDTLRVEGISIEDFRAALDRRVS